jgi:hypothetical protein
LGIIGVRIIVRDSYGRVSAARSLTLSSHANPLVAEAWVALYAVMLNKDSGLLDIILEGDALHVVNGIKSDFPSLSRIGHYTDEIKSELNFLCFSTILHMEKETNSIAHTLTKAAVFNVLDSI